MSQVKFHTVEQPQSDTTAFVLSCNRLDVLDQTLQSFLATRDYVTKMVIVDDSAEPGVFETLVERYGAFSDVICFPRNRSQWWAMDFMVSYCDSEYIFYVEDDWKFLQNGYLNKSKEILKKYRDIGLVDISWRTFEWQGIDSYDKKLIDDTFYYKKLWRISDYHLHWYGWCGSPNLKRRDDLILLGRVEKWHNEWNIDRRFLGLGFKSVYLNGQYVDHLGDNCSKMEGKRPDDSTTPESYYPIELLKNRTYPKFDYYQWDKHYRHPHDITLVTMMVDIDRQGRGIEEHYIPSIQNLLSSRHPVIVYCDEKYHSILKKMKTGAPLSLFTFDRSYLEKEWFFEPIKNIVTQRQWIDQSLWMQDSVISNPYYIPLTMMKQRFLDNTTRTSGASYYYWIDSGMFSSYNIQENINDFYFTKIPKDKFFMTSFPYTGYKEMHGFNAEKMKEIFNVQPNQVCRASMFGGSKFHVQAMTNLFYSYLKKSIDNGAVGAEESIYTLINEHQPYFFNLFKMESGDIKNYLKTIKQ